MVPPWRKIPLSIQDEQAVNNMKQSPLTQEGVGQARTEEKRKKKMSGQKEIAWIWIMSSQTGPIASEADMGALVIILTLSMF